MSGAKVIRRFPTGTVTLPPSKSLSHRAVICAGLAAGGGESRLHNIGVSQDITATTACMEQLAAKSGSRTLDCGESGSTLRFLIPLAAMAGGQWRFTGRGRLLQRPLNVYADIFKQAGAHFEQDADAVTMQGPLPGGAYHMPGNVSSQFLSGLLLALPMAEQDSTLVVDGPLESAAYVRLTLDVMAAFGVRATQNPNGSFSIPGGQRYVPASYVIEGDWSQAAFFLGAGVLGQPVRCAGLSPNSHQGDAAVLNVLRDMGADIRWQDGLVWATAGADGLRAATIDAAPIPDLVPPLAALCCFAQGTSRIVNAGRLRLKESDRLAAMAAELQKLGADVREEAESLTIVGKPSLTGGRVDAHGDHRIAMAMALAAIRCTGDVELTGWDSVEKSYPAFWTDFEKEARHG